MISGVPTTTLLATMAVSVVATPAVMAVLRRRGVVDTPGARSSHNGQVPRGGGLAVVLSLSVGVLLADGTAGGRTGLGIAAGTLLIGAVGAVDDLRGGVPVVQRMMAVGVVALAASLLIVGTNSWLYVAASIVGAVWVLSFTNAFNFMDGINGISGLHAIVIGMTYAHVANRAEVPAVAILAACLVASASGFLVWNLAGRVFLGDVGSYAIGSLSALCALALLRGGAPATACVGCLLPYLADTGLTVLRRIRAGDAIHLPHRSHAYQRIASASGSHGGTAAGVALVSATCAALTVWGSAASGGLQALAFGAAVVLSATYACVPAIAWPQVTRSIVVARSRPT